MVTQNKQTEEQKARLAELQGKQATLTDEEKTELEDLEAGDTEDSGDEEKDSD